MLPQYEQVFWGHQEIVEKFLRGTEPGNVFAGLLV
jgi:hypothetical protein